MSRGFWFVAGAGVGVYAMTRARRAAEAFTAEGLRDRLHALDVGTRMFRDEVAAGRAEREPELRRRLHLAEPGAPALTAPAANPGHEHPGHEHQPLANQEGSH